MNKLMDTHSANTEALLKETRAQNSMLEDLSEALRPETLLRLKNVTSAYFDFAIEKVCRLIDRVREENNIINRPATETKVTTLLTNIHEDRNSRFDSFTFRGRKISTLTNPEWVNWVKDVFLQELYNEDINRLRTYTNVKMVYEKIKIDFYHNLH